jgi:hypothetical protein
MADNVKIKFTKAYAVKAKDGEKYKEGQTVSVSPASAQHFLNRGVADEVGSEKAKDEEPAAETAPDFDSMTKADLEDHAKKNNIQGITSSMTKDEMVKAIKRAPK